MVLDPIPQSLPVHFCGSRPQPPHLSLGVPEPVWLIDMGDVASLYVWRDEFICVTWRTWLILTCDMTHSFVWHDLFLCVTRLIHMCDMTYSPLDRDYVFECVTWLIVRCHVWRDSSCGAMCDVTHRAVPCMMWFTMRCDELNSVMGSMCDVTHRTLRCDESHSVTGSMCDVTHSEVLHHIHTCDTTRSYEWHDSFTCVAWLVHMCDMTRSHVWHDSFRCVTCLIHTRDMIHLRLSMSGSWQVLPEAWLICGCKWHMRHDSFACDSFTCVTWPIHMWLIQMCDMTHSYVWPDPFVCVTWLIHMCDMTRSHVWHDWFICVTWIIHEWHHSFICVTWLIHMWDMTHSY